ncbi:hypothetical protein, partial [Kingella kingae]|uniref:hypothetical protein n=1 Tax=Kingella kingae TaxID=504 RepID=UPI001E5FF8ED
KNDTGCPYRAQSLPINTRFVGPIITSKSKTLRTAATTPNAHALHKPNALPNNADVPRLDHHN